MNTKGIDQLMSIITKGKSKTPGVLDTMFKQWGVHYLGFVRREFVKNSRGGGDWADLKASTKKGRRGGKRRRAKRGGRKTTTVGTGKRFLILRNFGILLKALTIRMPGNVFARIKNGIRVGFGGPARHKNSKLRIADIAITHDRGNPSKNLPRRVILKEPDSKLEKQLKGDVKTAIIKAMKQSEIK